MPLRGECSNPLSLVQSIQLQYFSSNKLPTSAHCISLFHSILSSSINSLLPNLFWFSERHPDVPPNVSLREDLKWRAEDEACNMSVWQPAQGVWGAVGCLTKLIIQLISPLWLFFLVLRNEGPHLIKWHSTVTFCWAALTRISYPVESSQIT